MHAGPGRLALKFLKRSSPPCSASPIKHSLSGASSVDLQPTMWPWLKRSISRLKRSRTPPSLGDSSLGSHASVPLPQVSTDGTEATSVVSSHSTSTSLNALKLALSGLHAMSVNIPIPGLAFGITSILVVVTKLQVRLILNSPRREVKFGEWVYRKVLRTHKDFLNCLIG